MRNLLKFIIIFQITLAAINSFAYNTADERFINTDTKEVYVGGHEQITDWSVKLAVKESIPVLPHSSELILGAHDEDFGNEPLKHFYNPATGHGLFGFLENAKTNARSWYEKAVKQKSFYSLGHALHLLQDMAAPSHAMNASHKYSYNNKVGYEWWVTKNWDSKIQPWLNNLEKADPTFRLIRGGDIDGYMDAMANATASGGYNYDEDFIHKVSSQPEKYNYFNVVSDSDAQYNASFLIPSIIRLGAGLLKTYCFDIGCGWDRPAANNSNPSGDHADDTFDVSSRLIELQQLDPTKELWKDIYGRTGIKKGYIGLFLEKELSKAYQEFATAKTEAEFNQYAVVFQAVLNNVQAASKHSFEETYYASPDVALLSNGFVDENADLLLKRIQEPIREIKDSFNAASMKNQPVLVIPSGGFMGLNSSTFFKSALDEYVRTGGTVIVFSQQHGYDYSVLPTPDGIPLAAYGWAEDQNCFWDGSYLDSYHQTMSSISTPLVSAGVDGYFTSWPTNATILLRRTANGQPALLMYDYGQGKVIVSSFYSDWGAAHAQATKQEIAIVRNLISWGKKPAVLPEIKLGETVSVLVTVSNSSATEAASIKFQIYTPDRSLLLNEQSVSTTIPVVGSSTSNVTWQAPLDISESTRREFA